MAADKKRVNFLSGFKNSPQGRYEDPTYFGFKIFFDIDGSLPVSLEDGLPPSPLFKDREYLFDNNSSNPFGLNEYAASNPTIAFHSAQSYLVNRESTWETPRANALYQFKSLLRQINDQSPWFFQSISGLNNLASVTKTGYNGSSSEEGFNPHRTGGKFLTINCLESLNIRITALAELYRQATFDYEYMRELLPRNLRKFKMYIIVSEVRNFNKTNRLSAASTTVRALENTANLLTNGMNPGNSINEVNNLGSNDLEGTAQNSIVSGILNKSGISGDLNFLNQSDQGGITPFIIFECSQCEFDFDSSYPIKETLYNGSNTADPETQSFKIYVDRVRTKIQMPNIRDDGKFLILADSFDQKRSSIKKVERADPAGGLGNNLVNSLLEQGENLLTNFVGNSVNDLINTQVNRLSRVLSGIDSSLLGNVYSFNPGAVIDRPSFDNVSQLADQFKNGLDLRSVFTNNSATSNPQTNGLGGPPQRVYPTPSGDVYENVPGTDLGVPDRIYNTPSGDVYQTVPGSDLGVPDRAYRTPSGDVYENVPGADLGGPERIYNTPSGDVYENVPGSDLGSPERIYPQTTGDFYPDSPGADLGVPDRVYPKPEGDVYRGVPGSDLGSPDRSYPKPKGDVYGNVPGTDLGVPSREYNLDRSTVYPPNAEQRQSSDLGDVYPVEPQQSQKLSSRVYSESDSSNGFDSPPPNQYGQQARKQTERNLGTLYPETSGDFTPDTMSLGNLKPFDRYNFSLDDVNGTDED